jgi:hypothetical protein
MHFVSVGAKPMASKKLPHLFNKKLFASSNPSVFPSSSRPSPAPLSTPLKETASVLAVASSTSAPPV